MEATEQQNSPVQQCATSETQQKQSRRKRRYGRKRKSTNPSTDNSASTDPNTVNSNENPAVPSSVDNPTKSNPVSPQRTYNNQQPLFKDSKPLDNPLSSPSKVSGEIRKTPADRPFSNNISRSYMDKMKRVDEEKSREGVLVEREARRLSKQKEQDKARNIGNVSPMKSVPKPEPKVEEKVGDVVNQTPSTTPVQNAGGNARPSDKSREEIMAERELKKQAKLGKKNKGATEAAPSNESATPTAVGGNDQPGEQSEKSREDIMAERELKKQAKLAKKSKTTEAAPTNETATTTDSIVKKLENATISEKPALTKAERREKQEAQRAAKAKLLAEKTTKGQPSGQSTETKSKPDKVEKAKEISPSTKKPVSVKLPQHKVKLFNHLYADKAPEKFINSNAIHPAIVKLGAQFANGNIVGSNARCIAFMERIKKVIEDYNTPSQKEFGRGLEAILHPCVNYLQQCRPLSVSITNALKFIKWQISQLPANQTDAESKEHLLESVDTYVRDQIEKAAQAISIFVQEKISNGDVILTFGCSSLICHIIEEAQKRNVDFSVIVVDSRPHHEGQEMLRRLVALKIRCTFVLINAIGFVMPDVTKVLLGANALLANGYVMSRAGTAQVALMAKFYNVPVLVCCETHKFSERVQTDAFVFNEIGNPQDLVLTTGKSTSNEMQNWKSMSHLTPLNLRYDVTPPELVAAVVTELAILPCTSVPVILRIKPSEIGY
ncbi:translation initiation factor eIF-2B subunit delta isoform X2 [Bradysia coprophila]|uniref:translation initiation factor eIF-2B subunit delta isoform X2 n=2 Tax=Bradysia coprophila TaxID=38358 RepID=UPI00187DC924|nr:translation initiation factor eIF-2B subunit delta isoform X2 [Bradysia coprophila]